MQKIKLAHIVTALVLVLFSVAIVHWIILPKGGLPKTAEFTEETAHPEELPTLRQNELYNLSTTLPSEKRLSSFEGSTGQDVLEPKPTTASGKEEL